MAGSAQAIRCSNCGAGVTIRAVGRSVAATCTHCKSILDLADPNLAILSFYKNAKNYDFALPLGKRGKLRGDTWELIGYVRRADTASIFEWDEYLLFNPLKGFKWLMCSNGHWTLIVVTKQKPVVVRAGKPHASYLGHAYDIFFEGKAKVVYVEGEFYWRVAVGETVKVQDFVRPPEVLSSEESDDEIVWSIGDYVRKDEIMAAFGPKLELPATSGVAPNQPSAVKNEWAKLLLYAVGLSMFLVIASTLQQGMAKGEEVFAQEFVYGVRSTDPSDKTIVTPPFDIKGGTSNVEFDLAAAELSNSWMEMELTLTNVETGEGVGLQHGLEYYSGVEGGYSWSEGSKTAEELVSAVPDGKYTLTIEPSGPTPPRPLRYLVRLRRNVADFSNLAWGALLLWLFPCFIAVRHWLHEVNRWSESDYSPYKES